MALDLPVLSFQWDESTLMERLSHVKWPKRFKIKHFNNNKNLVEVHLTCSNNIKHEVIQLVRNHRKNHCLFCYTRQTTYGCNLCKVLLCKTVWKGNTDTCSCFKIWHSAVDSLGEKQKHLTFVQIDGSSPDGGTVVEFRGKKSSWKGNDTPEWERKTKKMKRTPTSQNKKSLQCNSSPKRRLTPNRNKTPQKRMTPHIRKILQKTMTNGGMRRKWQWKKAGFSYLKEKSITHTLKWYKQRGSTIKCFFESSDLLETAQHVKNQETQQSKATATLRKLDLALRPRRSSRFGQQGEILNRWLKNLMQESNQKVMMIVVTLKQKGKRQKL